MLIGRFLKKNLWCRFFHRKHRCYPEVWKVDIGNWHCDKCSPCSEWIDKLEKQLDTLERYERVD